MWLKFISQQYGPQIYVEFTIDGKNGVLIFRGFASAEVQSLTTKIEIDTVEIVSYIICLFINGDALFLQK